MTNTVPSHGMELRSTVTADGRLIVSFEQVPVPTPGTGEVLVRVEAAPLHPADIGLLFGPADLTSGIRRDDGGIELKLPEKAMPGLKMRWDQSLPVGNEAAGTVVAAGDDQKHLIGRSVAMMGGGMLTQYRLRNVEDCIVLPEGAKPSEGASALINPLTALLMIETLKREGHRALIHTAAASSLGQMLVRICQADGIGLVNIVRRQDQVDLLKAIGATHVCNSSDDDYLDQLFAQVAETDATLAFDALSGGSGPSQMLSAMEAAQLKKTQTYSRYGSSVDKRVYFYGGMNPSKTELDRSYGMSWSVGGWLIFHEMKRTSPEVLQNLKDRIANELKTTFAISYAGELPMTAAADPEHMQVFTKRATGMKYIFNPNA